MNDEPVSLWIEGLRAGDQSAAKNIWEFFVKRLCLALQRKLRTDTRRVYDEEDAAASAFRSLCEGMAHNRYPDLRDRESLWRLILVIASRKVIRRHRHDLQDKRDIRRSLDESVFQLPENSGFAGLEQFASREPTPEFEAEFLDTSAALFSHLDDPLLQAIARLKVEGFTDEEIAGKLTLSRQAVQRKMERIRRNWGRYLKSVEDSDNTRAEFTRSGINT